MRRFVHEEQADGLSHWKQDHAETSVLKASLRRIDERSADLGLVGNGTGQGPGADGVGETTTPQGLRRTRSV